jgi:site-specific DNA-methyltransferase (adenine-specific)
MPHNDSEWEPVSTTKFGHQKTKRAKPKPKPSKLTDDDIQQALNSFRAIKEANGRELFLNQANQLMESKEIEDELNDEYESEVKKFNKANGKEKDKSTHLFVAGDIREAKVLHRIKAKRGPVEVRRDRRTVDLIFTSPPYNADIEYDEWNDKLSFEKYKEFLDESFGSCDTLLNKGCRIVVNIRDIGLGTGERYPVVVLLHELLCKKRGYKYRGVHIWYKGREESTNAWGSYRSSKNPSIVDLFEYVFVFQKPGDREQGKDDIQKTDFVESVIGVWKIRPVKKIFGVGKKNVAQHPCPFPPELARRVIKLYSQCGDTVLDPFGGIGSTSIGAITAGRNSVSVDISKKYCDVAYERIAYDFPHVLIGKA